MMWVIVYSLEQVWVSSPHNATGYYTVYGEEALHADHFNTKLSFGDTQTVWARTGYLGFLRRTELTDANGGETPARPPLNISLFQGLSSNVLILCVSQSVMMRCMWWGHWTRLWS